jgi:mono/diheme cytochrome c family protein
MTVSAGLVGMYQFGRVDPYVQSVLARFGNASQGQDIFQMNCAICHGTGGVGNVGPSLKAVSARKSRTGLITQVISGKTPPMPQFQPSPQEMADLLSYLENL